MLLWVQDRIPNLSGANVASELVSGVSASHTELRRYGKRERGRLKIPPKAGARGTG